LKLGDRVDGGSQPVHFGQTVEQRWSDTDAGAPVRAASLHGENAVIVQKRGGDRVVLRCRRPTGNSERGDRAVKVWIVGCQDFDVLQVANLPDPPIPQSPKASRSARWADRLVELERSRYREKWGRIRRSHVDAVAGLPGGAGAIPSVAIELGGRAAPNVEDAHSERGAEPLVAVEPDEIAVEIDEVEVELAPAVGCVDDRIDPAFARECRYLADRDDQTGPVAQMGEQDQADVRISTEGFAVCLEERSLARRLGQRDPDYFGARAVRQGVHATLHRVVIEIGIEHRVAGLEPIVAVDQRLQGLRRVAGEGDLSPLHAQRFCEPLLHQSDVAAEAAPGVETGVTVEAGDMLEVLGVD